MKEIALHEVFPFQKKKKLDIPRIQHTSGFRIQVNYSSSKAVRSSER